MRRALSHLLFSILLFETYHLHAQNDRFVYAITDFSNEASGWNSLRKLDLQTGEYGNIILNGTDQFNTIYDATTKKKMQLQSDAKWGTLLNAAFSTGVAAAAYDRHNQRLYYTPMFVDQLRYIDLRTMKVYFVNDQVFTKYGKMHNNEARIVTRMVMASDGNGYAVTNDGNSLIRFTTGKKIKIEQMGALVDDPSNNTVSIHNRCSSFGGDMISDDKGNLYIISSRNHVFKVNPETRIAKYLGMIQDLPAKFTINGAVVNEEGALLVSSALDGSAYYVVDPKSWTAKPYKAAHGIFRASDLANSNFLSTREENKKDEGTVITPRQEKFSDHIRLFPNPVTDNRLTLEFTKLPFGEYTIELTDGLGRSLQQKRITISSPEHTQTMSLHQNNSKGMYMVKVMDRGRNTVYTEKVMIQ
jgi:hypothetical protein